MANRIPQRKPVGDWFSGYLLKYATATLLSTTALGETETLAQGDLVVRYAVRYLEQPNLSIVPALVALDYGDILNGDEAWELINTQGNLYPRADVFGHRNDGKDDMIVLKKLDFAQAFDVLVLEDEHATNPIATANALIALPDAKLPERLREYLPPYPSLDAWKNRAL